MKAEQKLGRAGEDLAAKRLRMIGVCMVERIGTPVKIIQMPNWLAEIVRRYSKLSWVHVVFGEKVSGDFRGILPGGQSVLVECKTIIGRNMQWSDLREHQPGRLTEHAEHGGLSLLAWVHEYGVTVMRWPVPGFGPGKGLEVATAEDLDVGDLSF